MTDEELKNRQADAKTLIAATENPVDREILSFAYSAMIARLIRSQTRDRELVFEPVELLEILKLMLKDKEVIVGLITGKYSTLEEAFEDLGIF